MEVWILNIGTWIKLPDSLAHPPGDFAVVFKDAGRFLKALTPKPWANSVVDFHDVFQLFDGTFYTAPSF